MLQQTQDDHRTNSLQTDDLYRRFLRLWCNPPKKVVGEWQTFENNVLFSENLLPFPPLTASTRNSTNMVYLLKQHLYHAFPVWAVPTPQPSQQSISPQGIILSLPQSPPQTERYLMSHYLKHPCFPPRYTACADQNKQGDRIQLPN